ITVLGRTALFSDNDTAGQTGLWVTDGTVAGTYELADVPGALSMGTEGLSPAEITAFGPSEAVFRGNDNLFRTELWITDGTVSGTHEITDVQGESRSGLAPGNMTVFGTNVLFSGNGASG